MTNLDFFLTYGREEGFLTEQQSDFLRRMVMDLGEWHPGDSKMRSSFLAENDSGEAYFIEGGLDNFYLDVEPDLDVR